LGQIKSYGVPLWQKVCVGGNSAARESLVGTFVTANTKRERETMRELREMIEEQTKRESHRSGKRHFMWCGDGGEEKHH
jgi:hypothetical protein